MAGKFQIQKRPFSQLFPPSFLRKESCQKLLDYWLVDALVRPIESQCLKITEKVSSNIASEASYVYNLGRQKIIKNAKYGQFLRVYENLNFAVKQCYQIGQF